MGEAVEEKRRVVSGGRRWAVEETLSSNGKATRAYYYRKQLALRLELEGHKVKRLAGFTLLKKDLLTIGAWLDALQKIVAELGADQEQTDFRLMPDAPADVEKVTVARGLFVAIVTTYGKLFTKAKGRGVTLAKKGWVPSHHAKTHDFLLHTRHTFVTARPTPS